MICKSRSLYIRSTMESGYENIEKRSNFLPRELIVSILPLYSIYLADYLQNISSSSSRQMIRYIRTISNADKKGLDRFRVLRLYSNKLKATLLSKAISMAWKFGLKFIPCFLLCTPPPLPTFFNSCYYSSYTISPEPQWK